MPAGEPRRDDVRPDGDRRDGERPVASSIFDVPLDEAESIDALAGAGRRRRARGEKGFERELDTELLTDREDIVPVPVAPTRRLVSLAIAGFAGLLGLALIFGGYLVPKSFALVIFAVQVLFVVSWTVSTRPAGARIVAGVGLGAAVVADLAVAWPTHATLAPLGYVTAGAFVAGMIGQLARRDGRSQVTESLGATLVMVVGVVAYASLIVLSRNELGPESIAACLVAATVAIVVARRLDAVVPVPAHHAAGRPRHDRHHRRRHGRHDLVRFRGIGLVGLSPGRTVYAGLVTAVAAVLADLGVGYAEASREIDGDVCSLWVVRHMQGPLGAFALAAPVAYAMSVMVLLPALS